SGTDVDWISVPGSETIVYQVKISNQGNLYLTGTTTETENFATPGAYLETPPTLDASHFFLMKMTADGVVIWATYLEDYVGLGFVNRFAIDQDENIYFTSSRDGVELPAPCIECTPNPLRYDYALYYTPIIRKFTADGEHAWSTYYGVDSSDIRGIYSGEQGLYVYGEVHRTNTLGDGTVSQHNYFGTEGAYIETPNPISNREHYYISKFSYEGER